MQKQGRLSLLLGFRKAQSSKSQAVGGSRASSSSNHHGLRDARWVLTPDIGWLSPGSGCRRNGHRGGPTTRLDQAELQSTDIHEGIESTLALLTPQWIERIRVVRRFSDLPKIQCYSSALNQVFMTLLANASEAIERDGTISITTEKGDDCIRISISDDGGGIAPERLERIFEIGFSRKGNQMRMHTGLANVYGIVKKHNGHVEVRSEPNRGTTFEISLPVSQGD